MSETTDSLDGSMKALHSSLLGSWNARDAAGFAGCFAEEGCSIGFDGSTVVGGEAIEQHLTGIFADHSPAAYVAVVREVRRIGADAALLRAVVGMVPPGQEEVNPAANAVQSLVAEREGDQWRIALFQSTPAAFHGRPEEAERLTRELSRAAKD